jgi:hypothetical protein
VTTYEKQELHSILARLPPGPWHAKGDTIYAGDRIVCVVMEWQNDNHIAEQLARLPDLIAATVSRTSFEELEEKLATAEAKVEELEDALSDPLDGE